MLEESNALQAASVVYTLVMDVSCSTAPDSSGLIWKKMVAQATCTFIEPGSVSHPDKYEKF